jgi:hypothetical protein
MQRQHVQLRQSQRVKCYHKVGLHGGGAHAVVVRSRSCMLAGV